MFVIFCRSRLLIFFVRLALSFLFHLSLLFLVSPFSSLPRFVDTVVIDGSHPSSPFASSRREMVHYTLSGNIPPDLATIWRLAGLAQRVL